MPNTVNTVALRAVSPLASEKGGGFEMRSWAKLAKYNAGAVMIDLEATVRCRTELVPRSVIQ